MDTATSNLQMKRKMSPSEDIQPKRPRLTLDTATSPAPTAMTPSSSNVGSATSSATAYSLGCAGEDAGDSPTSPTHDKTHNRRTGRKRYACDFPGCGRNFDRISRLEIHQRTHYRGERTVACEFDGCGKSFFEVKHMREHVGVVHKRTNNFVCEVPGCGLAFRSRSHLQRHGKVHTNANAHRCEGHSPCAQSFRKAETLVRHIRSDHLGLRPFVCLVGADSVDATGGAVGGCGESFTTRETLKAHELKEHGAAAYFCSECQHQPGSRFDSKEALQAHIQSNHLRCELCNLGFDTASQVRAHEELFHSAPAPAPEPKTYPCKDCPREFASRGGRRQHVRTAHMGVRWVCGQVDLSGQPALEEFDLERDGCGKEFTTKAAVMFHTRYVHLGQKRPTAKLRGMPKPEPPAPANALAEWLAAPDDGSRRHVCHYFGCGARFVRHHDLRRHLAEHANGDDDLDELRDSGEEDDEGFVEYSSAGTELRNFGDTGNMLGCIEVTEGGSFWGQYVPADDAPGEEAANGHLDGLFDVYFNHEGEDEDEDE